MLINMALLDRYLSSSLLFGSPRTFRALCSMIDKKNKFLFTLDREVKSSLESNKIKANTHPGKINTKNFNLLVEFLENIYNVLDNNSQQRKVIIKNAKELKNYIWSRHLPIESCELEKKVNIYEQELITSELVDPFHPNVTEDQQKRLLDSRRSKLHMKLKKTLYNWNPVEYDTNLALAYMSCRTVPDFVSLHKIFSEIKLRDKEYTPTFFLDFGSGLCSGLWAVHSIWPESCKEALCVDASNDMINLARSLLKLDDNASLTFKHSNINFRQYLPTSEAIKYSLVLSSRSFFELSDFASRMRTMDILWRKVLPGGYLVIVEAGSKAGHQVITEARDYIVDLGQKALSLENDERLVGQVFSPCVHNLRCPKLDTYPGPCNFCVSYMPLSYFASVSARDKDIFSYVVIKKTADNVNASWPRVVQEVLNPKGHVILRTCTAEAKLQEFVATKKRHGSLCYKVAKCTDWGDLLPISCHRNTEEDNESLSNNIKNNECIQTSTG